MFECIFIKKISHNLIQIASGLLLIFDRNNVSVHYRNKGNVLLSDNLQFWTFQTVVLLKVYALFIFYMYTE